MISDKKQYFHLQYNPESIIADGNISLMTIQHLTE